MSLLAELKRRNVFRVALFYLVSAWLVVQVAETLLPIFDVPDGVLRAIVFILALGFVPALVFAWAFELTPDGLKRDRDARVDPSTKQQTAQKLNWATLSAAVLAIGLLAADRLLLETAIESQGAERPPSEDSTATASATAPSGASIAVLPFVNMSPDPDNAYFADGISEELLNILAGIEGLTVASRTSAFSFRNSERPIPEIADILGVRYVLEGSVRKQGEQVRITAQLIDAENDAHLWSDTYDRLLDNIFVLQEDIAESITGALTDRLGIGGVTVAAPTQNLDAYELYLRGRSLFHQRISLDEAISFLRRAVDLDPEFADAWAFLAATEFVTSSGGYPTERDLAELRQSSAVSAERALALDSTIAIALAVQGQLLINRGSLENIEAGLSLLADASATMSTDTTAEMWLGLNKFDLGHAEAAFGHLERATELDPLVAINHGYLGVVLTALGRRSQGAQHALRALELSGEIDYWLILVAFDAAHAGDFEQAAEYLRISAAPTDPLASAVRFQEIEQALNEQIGYEEYVTRYPVPDHPLSDTYRMMLALALRDNEAALELYPVANGNAQIMLVQAAWLPALESLREDPRFFQVVEDRGYIEYWTANGYPLDCRRVETDGVARLACGDDP